LVTVKSQFVLTFVTTVVVLVFTEFAALSVEVAVIVGTTMLGATLTTTTMLAVAPTARLGSVQLTFPVEPTAGAVHVHPAGARTDWNVVFGGVASVKFAAVAATGPLFVTVCVYVMSFPASTVEGDPVVVSTRFACAAPATMSVATAELDPYDWFVAFTVAVSVITVPLAVPTLTL
jgi:hypothetical protein